MFGTIKERVDLLLSSWSSRIATIKMETAYGPWTVEPDGLYWVECGLHCLILRQKLLHLCGYVGVEKDHPLWGYNYQDPMPPPIIPEQRTPLSIKSRRCVLNDDDIFGGSDLNAHGGITLTDTIDDSIPDVWWIGFDCAHLWDMCPYNTVLFTKIGIGINHRNAHVTYRDIGYVKREIRSLVEQIHNMYRV